MRIADGTADPFFDPRFDLRQACTRTWSQTGNTGQVGNDNTTEDCSVFFGEDYGFTNAGYVTSVGGNQTVSIASEDPALWPLFEVTMVLDPYWKPA